MSTQTAATIHRSASATRRTWSANPAARLFQRRCACGGTCENCRPTALSLDRHTASTRQTASLPPSGRETLGARGRPLDPAARTFMEPRFGHDFSSVRLHTDDRAARSAREVNALAYTVGDDIAFAPGHYAPDTRAGRRLLAHELAHVVQQRRAPAAESDSISQPDDQDEGAADSAAESVAAGRTPSPGRSGARRGLHRQTPGLGTLPASAIPSQGELVLESFLSRMWAAQSKGEKPFRITPRVREGLGYLFAFVPSLPLTDYPSPKDVIDRLRSQIPSNVDANVVRVLDHLPAQEKRLSGATTPSSEPAKPAPGPAPAPPGAGAARPAEAPKGYDEAAAKAAEAAFEEFRRTALGQELEKWGKDYVLSKEGIPFDILVAGGVLTFVAANDPKLPSPPPIPLGDGIKLKIDYSGRISDLPPLLRDLVQARTEPPKPGKAETKIGVSVTFTFEALGEFAKSVGQFFVKAARWLADGAVKIGTMIGKGVTSIQREILATLGGAALGAGIGALAAGGIGALIGAGIGAAVGLGGALISHLFDKKKART
jgi:hypothetical protein